MTPRRSPRSALDAEVAKPEAPASTNGTSPRVRSAARDAAAGGLSQRLTSPRTRAEVEEHYVATRDAWAAAMRAANSGRAADLAALAIAQEAYEAAVHERELWESGARVAIPVEPETPHADLGAIVGQELAWRQVHAPKPEPNGLFGRIRRRLRAR